MREMRLPELRWLWIVAGYCMACEASVTDETSSSPEPAPAAATASTRPVAIAARVFEEGEGEPLPGVLGDWRYTELPETQCRDGSPSGVAVNLGTSDKVLLYLEGGGWCIDQASCELNAADASGVLLLGLLWASGGVFDRNNPENPLRDWNFVYVPYCTGDWHVGANQFGEIGGLGRQRFVGYANLKKSLRRIAPTFQNATAVLLTGASAGGKAALLNAIQVQRAFPNVKVSALSDSGALLSTAAFAECLQEHVRTLWKLDDSVLSECGAACPEPAAFAEDFAVFLAETLHDRPLGLIHSTEDEMLRAFLGQGDGDCTGSLDFETPGLPNPRLRNALLSLRERLAPYPNFSSFLPDGSAHTRIWIAVPGLTADFYAESAGGVRLVDWVSRFVRGENPGHAGLEVP